MKSRKKEVLPGSKKVGLGKNITLQQINRYLVENNIRSLEVNKEGEVKIRFKI